jgi:hypothetical protein
VVVGLDATFYPLMAIMSMSAQKCIWKLTINKKRYGCKRSWETVQHYTWTRIKVKELRCYFFSAFRIVDSTKNTFSTMYNMWLLVWMLHFIRSWLLGCAVHHSHGHHGWTRELFYFRAHSYTLKTNIAMLIGAS